MSQKKIFLLLLGSMVLSFSGCKYQGSGKVRMHHAVPALHKVRINYPYVTEFEKFVRETMEQTHIPGAAIAIVKDTDLLLLRGYGVKKFGTHDSVDIHSVFRIASVSKGFASMLAGILVQKDKIGWDDKVIQYLPDFRLSNDESTKELAIRNILSHTSGLPLHTFTNLIERGVPYDTLRDHLRTVKVAAPVGTEFAYQNVMYSVIGDIAAKVTGKSYAGLLQDLIFNPLHMTDASASYDSIEDSKDLALPHIRRSATTYVPIRITPQFYSVLPAAGVNASISDMAKWMMALLGERQQVISDTILQQIFKPEIYTPRMHKYEFFRWPHLRRAYYGLGWRILNYENDTLVYHGGHVNGYRSEVGFCPADNIGIVILTNSTGKLANDGVKVFFDAFFAYKRSLEKGKHR